MNLLSSLYGLGVKTRNQLYERQVLRSRKLNGAVISVGSLSAGGAGKTPFVLCLGELLKQRGIPFDILSRGYGRSTSGVAEVDPGGTAQEFGDEPLLMARRLRVPVVVGENRYEAGAFAEARFSSQLHLLDDGFQHRALARDFEIVLLTAEDVTDLLLPAGRLREPLTSLSRADAVVWGGGASADLSDLNLPELDQKMVWGITRNIVPGAVPSRPVVFCGIARPHNFFSELRSQGIAPIAEAIYRDHHPYTERDIDHLLTLREQKHGQGFVTTEKDAVNLGGLLARLDPVVVIPVKIQLTDAANALDTMLHTIRERKQKA